MCGERSRGGGTWPLVFSVISASAPPRHARARDSLPRRPELGVSYQAGERLRENEQRRVILNLLLIIVVIVAVLLLITGGFVQSLQFLVWVGIVLAVIAVIVFLMRAISGRKNV